MQSFLKMRKTVFCVVKGGLCKTVCRRLSLTAQPAAACFYLYLFILLNIFALTFCACRYQNNVFITINISF